MNIGQVKKFYEEHENTPCPLTERLIKGGYQQVSGGYIDRAKANGITVDYRAAKPTQYWHLMTYCDSRPPTQTFGKSVVCGELIFWMAEVSDCVPETTLSDLADRIIVGEKPFDRKKWNKVIQSICFDAIKATVESA